MKEEITENSFKKLKIESLHKLNYYQRTQAGSIVFSLFDNSKWGWDFNLGH